MQNEMVKVGKSCKETQNTMELKHSLWQETKERTTSVTTEYYEERIWLGLPESETKGKNTSLQGTVESV